VKIINAEITGSNRIGILIGAAMGGGNVFNVHVQGKIIADGSWVGSVGGIVGDGWTCKIYSSSANVEIVGNCLNSDGCTGGIGVLAGGSQGSIANCWANGTVNVTNSCNIGGLVGYQGSGYIYNSKSTVNVTGTLNNTGGLIGQSGGEIRECYASGTVQGVNSTGGLIGAASGNYCLISQSYATGSVTGKIATGGLIGYVFLTPNVTQTYATGLVTGDIQSGGLIGDLWRINDAQNVNMSYWDVETTKMKESVAGVGKDTTEMYLQETYEDWDFKTVWGIYPGKGYPYLLSTP